MALRQGAYTTRFTGLTFINTSKRVSWTAPFKEIVLVSRWESPVSDGDSYYDVYNDPRPMRMTCRNRPYACVVLHLTLLCIFFFRIFAGLGWVLDGHRRRVDVPVLQVAPGVLCVLAGWARAGLGHRL